MVANEGVYGNSVLSAPFSCKPKTALKKLSLLIIFKIKIKNINVEHSSFPYIIDFT